MWAPPAGQIREANAHLAALHGRVAELERRLGAAERTGRGQAESLIRKDGELRAALRELGAAKDREITALQQKLLSSEETIQKLLNVIQKKDDLIVQLKHRSHLLTKICRNRPILDNLLSYMAEGEQLSTLPGTQSDSSSPVHDEFQESNCITNQISKHKDFSLSEDDLEDQELDTSQFGTTV
ncbi:vimentin-type intermediate filament-associated coiled-coil protein [Malaclemys terrapin pileata]|uniref:vimentin-type intermediate filament-associated coiled-coil protein n=1 Tax=Malaclemys terrapin pileata TaxID=2991368 RepID=UPI0023A82E8E|nr:vimentin-type intermediate filament-associated coiled-coil protein [Malaclemys terrapin pileata]